MSLSTLIEVGSHYQEIASYLDRLNHASRWKELERLSRREQDKLYALVASAPPLTVDFFVPPDVPNLQEVIHHGKNTLPLPSVLKRFQKRFCRPIADSSVLYGYNEGMTRRWIGPGYFVAESTAGNRVWESRGSVVVNYFKVPDGPVPDSWPRVVPNHRGLQMFVFNKTRDFMRRVSAHVSIGAAYRYENPLLAWFILCREER